MIASTAHIVRTRSITTVHEKRALYLVVATIPGGIGGLLLNDYAETTFRSPLLIATTLSVMGVVLWAVDRWSARVRSIEEVTMRDAHHRRMCAGARARAGCLALRLDDHGRTRVATRPAKRRAIQLPHEHADHARRGRSSRCRMRFAPKAACHCRSLRSRDRGTEQPGRDHLPPALCEQAQLRNLRGLPHSVGCGGLHHDRAAQLTSWRRGTRVGRRARSDALPSAAALGLARLVHEREVASTMDVAHALAAEGAPAGVLVVADRQLRGRGRGGRPWESADGAGVWMTLLERPDDPRVIGVLALRLGLAMAEALAPFVDAPISLKWPNDLYVGHGKLAGILVEARWRESARGLGRDRRRRQSSRYRRVSEARRFAPDVSRAALLLAIIPRLRAAASTPRTPVGGGVRRVVCARPGARSSRARTGCWHRGGHRG